MKSIEKIKFIFGFILISFAILGGLIFFFESFGIFNRLLDHDHISGVFKGGWIRYSSERSHINSGGGASNIPTFLGLCGLAGACLLKSIPRPIKENKNDNNSKVIDR